MSESTSFDFQVNYSVQYLESYFLKNILANFQGEDVTKITNALNLARKFHSNQLRADGSPYIVHPLRVAIMIYEYDTLTPELSIVALLHDTLEDTAINEVDIKQAFGSKILTLIKAVTRYKNERQTPIVRKEDKVNKWREIMKSERDIRIIKTFDYLDNMISWKFIKTDQPGYKKIPRWLMEAQFMYIPLGDITNVVAANIMKKEFLYYVESGINVGSWFSDN